MFFKILLYRVTDILKGFFFYYGAFKSYNVSPFVIWAKFVPNLKEI